MKIRNIVLSFLAIITLIFFSCAKEEILPNITTNGDSPRTFINEFTKDENQKQLPQLNTLEEAMESISFNELTVTAVAIKSYSCRGGTGRTLIAHNPHVQGLDFYDSCNYLVLWFKDGIPVRGTYYLNCVCNGEYVAIVLNKKTKQGVGIAFHTVRRSCYGRRNVMPTVDK